MRQGLHLSNMVGHDTAAQEGDRYDRAVPFPQIGRRTQGSPLGVFNNTPNNQIQMTLCGSEVPQDRWRGRTAGSGM